MVNVIARAKQRNAWEMTESMLRNINCARNVDIIILGSQTSRVIIQRHKTNIEGDGIEVGEGAFNTDLEMHAFLDYVSKE